MGQARLRVDRPRMRCTVIDVDPTNGASGPRVPRGIPKERRACLGVYSTPVAPGTVAVGDLVLLHGR